MPIVDGGSAAHYAAMYKAGVNSSSATIRPANAKGKELFGNCSSESGFR